MAYTNDWSDAIPVDHTKFKATPGAVRQSRIDVEDRLKNIFYGFISGETQTDEGIKVLPFRYQAGDPAPAANKIQIYTKQIGGKAELFSVDEDNHIRQLTSKGNWVAGMTGEVKMWSGTIATIPISWQLCDGTNGSPDLRDKFIVGAKQDDLGVAKTNISGSLTQTGGANTHDHGGATGAHQLTVAEMPSHTHPTTSGQNGGGGSGGSQRWSSGSSTYGDNSGATGGDGTHTHPMSSANNIPTYYALAFIYKL